MLISLDYSVCYEGAIDQRMKVPLEQLLVLFISFHLCSVDRRLQIHRQDPSSDPYLGAILDGIPDSITPVMLLTVTDTAFNPVSLPMFLLEPPPLFLQTPPEIFENVNTVVDIINQAELIRKQRS
jgi:hypothetical protein